MKKALVLALLLTAAPLTGCLASFDGEDPQGDDDPLPAEDALAAMTAQGGDHDHRDPSQHDVSYQTQLLDHHPVVDEGPSGTHALTLAEEEDLLFVSSTIRGDHGFYVMDVSDPANMEVLGSYHDERLVGSDRSIAVTEDARWVVIGTEGDVASEEAAVWLFDVSDPTQPEPAAMSPLYGGAHTVETMSIDGTQYVFALNAGVEVLRVLETPLGTELLKTGKYTIAAEDVLENPYLEDDPNEAQSFAYRSLWAHDMMPVDDPDEGPLLYVAYAYQGLHVLDLSVPEAPQLVSTWVPQDDNAPWYVHSVDAAHIDDRRVIVVGTEVFEDRHEDVPSPLWVLDGDNLEDIQLLSTWTNPGDVGAQHLLFSLHFYRLDSGHLHVSHYHAGTWTLDLSTQAKQENPEILGAYLPNQDTGYTPEDDCCLGWNMAAMPITMDVVGDGPVTYAADLHTGVYAIENTAIGPGP